MARALGSRSRAAAQGKALGGLLLSLCGADYAMVRVKVKVVRPSSLVAVMVSLWLLSPRARALRPDVSRPRVGAWAQVLPFASRPSLPVYHLVKGAAAPQG